VVKDEAMKTLFMLNLTMAVLGLCFSSEAVVSRLKKRENPIEFEIVIPSYNNERWCIMNLRSVCEQDYPHFHITYIDDCSSDATRLLVEAFVAYHHCADKITVIHNTQRCGAMKNLYSAIWACPDDTIVVTLDGDDMLADNKVLSKLAAIYREYDVWMTYGQFKEWPYGNMGWNRQVPVEIQRNNTFRQWDAAPSHLRTFYAWLFKKIKLEDFFHEGKFYVMTWDLAMMFPMIEMAGDRYMFISDVLYLYNIANVLNDHKVDINLQRSLANEIRSKPPYQRLEQAAIPLPERKKVNILPPLEEQKKLVESEETMVTQEGQKKLAQVITKSATHESVVEHAQQPVSKTVTWAGFKHKKYKHI
jgi:glycosyltransferase involved in cell wall biosynthesis